MDQQKRAWRHQAPWQHPGVISTVSLETLLAPFRPPTTSLVHRLRYWLEAQGDALAFGFLADGETLETEWTYADLDHKSRAIAARLQW